MNKYLLFLLFACSLCFLTACGSVSSAPPPPPAVAITAASGSEQSATVSKAFALSLVATITTGGTPTSGLAVTFTAPTTGASGTFANGTNTTMVTTGAIGEASVAFSANGTAGTYAVTATTPGATAAANFNLTNTAGAAAEITCTSGSGQSAGINTAFGAPLVVQVADSEGNPVNNSGVVVTYTPPASGASATFAGGINTATTNASGAATSATVSANGIAGTYTVAASATISGVVKACNFSLTNTLGLEVFAASGTPQSTAVNTAFPAPLVMHAFFDGVPESDAGVIFKAPATGASGTFSNGSNTIEVSTDMRGMASTTFTANGTPGSYTVTAKLTGHSPLANFSLTNTAATVAATGQIQAPAGSGQHHHYKLIEPATFGGPGSRINGFVYSTFSSVQDLNSAGTLTGWADTSTPDPYEPNFCFNDDCYVAHAFQLQNGVITDLGVLPGGLSSATSWISANGLIAGTSQNGETDPLYPGAPEDRAVLWRNGKIIDLGTLPEGGYESGAQAVNSSGQVVGWALNTVLDPYSMGVWSNLYNNYEPFPYPYQNRAFLWQNGVMQDLGTLGTGTDAFAMAINEAGQVVGISYTDATPNQVTTPCATGPIPTQDPFLWENGKMIDLGTLGGTCGFPSWINNYGQVVGWSDLAGDLTNHAFLWTKAKGMQDLGTLGGSSSEASMINDSGLIVGGSDLEGDDQADAFLWNGKMHDLGTVDGSSCTYAFSVNAQEQVVGNDCGGAFAFLWEDGGPMVDLSTLISSNPGFSALNVIIINDSGEIAGQGYDASGFPHPVLLIPCDENHPGIEGCDYSVVDAATLVSSTTPPLHSRDAAQTTQVSLGPLLQRPSNALVRQVLPRRLGAGPLLLRHNKAGAENTPAAEAGTSLRITSGSPPSGTVGREYDVRCNQIPPCNLIFTGFPVTAAGGLQPYSWSWTAQQESSLPPGLLFPGGSECRGYSLPAICGKPTTAGSYEVVITVADSESPPHRASELYTIRILLSPLLDE